MLVVYFQATVKLSCDLKNGGIWCLLLIQALVAQV